MTSLAQSKGPAHGFTLKKSVVTNATLHVGATFVLNLDLLDFFPSIHFGRIRGVFSHQPFSFSPEVSAALAQLCSHAKTLPPGAPTSPIISNLVCRGLDRDLLGLARRHRCKYTRYADDITFSTRLPAFPLELVTSAQPIVELGSDLKATLDKHDFKPNPAKTRLSAKTCRQMVTGLVVNEKVNLRRRYVRNIRAILDDCRRNGLSSAEARFKEKFGDPSARLVNHLRGKLDYLSMVRGASDGLYLRYAIELERIAQTRRNGILLGGRAALQPSFLAEAMWVIIGRNRDGIEVKQGTAFGLKGHGIVSAAHVFETDHSDPAVRWEIIKASPPSSRFSLNSWQALDHFDLAIVKAPVRHTAMLQVSTREVKTGDRVVVAGFPNWRTPADQLQVQPATVTQTRIVSLVSYILTDAYIREGASGGPLVDQTGMVVGVALQGPAGVRAPNGGVAIAHLQEAPISS